jgi:glutaredoxin
MEVMIFTNPGCKSCERAKSFLVEHHVSYIERNLATDPTATDELLSGGFRSLPVIRVGGEAIQGFDPVVLKTLLGI